MTSGTTQYLAEIEIPKRYNKVPVTQILESAFSGATNLNRIIIPNSITSIGDLAFLGCKNLTSITIPDSVTSIGVLAFKNCESLTSITIPDSVTGIGDLAFYNCYDLASITFEGTVAEWNAIEFGDSWREKVPATEVICSDGVVKLR